MSFRTRIAAGAALALLALAPSQRAAACSQCMCGDPFPTLAFGQPTPALFRYGLENRYLSKDNALADEPGREDQRENRLAGFAMMHPADRVVLLARVPYVFKRIEESPDGAPSSIESAQGFGDAEALGRFRIARLRSTSGPGGGLALTAGFAAPTGRNHLTDDEGVRLEQHLQPGTGAWSGQAGLELAAPVGSFLVEADVMGRANGANDIGYHYGNALLYDVGAGTRRFGAWQFLAHVNGRSAAQDRVDDAGDLDPNSGGGVTYVAPGVRYFGVMGLVVDAGAQLPVIESLTGDQDEHATARLSVSLAPW